MWKLHFLAATDGVPFQYVLSALMTAIASVFGALLKSERDSRKQIQEQYKESRDYNKELVGKIMDMQEPITKVLTESTIAVNQATMVIHDAQEAEKRRQS